MLSYQYRNSHYKNEMVSPPSHLYNGNAYTSKDNPYIITGSWSPWSTCNNVWICQWQWHKVLMFLSDLWVSSTVTTDIPVWISTHLTSVSWDWRSWHKFDTTFKHACQFPMQLFLLVTKMQSIVNTFETLFCTSVNNWRLCIKCFIDSKGQLNQTRMIYILILIEMIGIY